MITFNQKIDSYRPLNRVIEIAQVDIVRTLKVINLINSDIWTPRCS